MTIFSDNPHDRRIERFMTAIPNFKPRGVGVRFSESQVLITITAATPTEILAETMRQIRYNDCPEIRELYKEYNFFDFKRVHSMAQKYEAGKEFPELLIANYDLFERERQQPHQLTLFDSIDKPLDYEKILKENIVCRIKR